MYSCTAPYRTKSTAGTGGFDAHAYTGWQKRPHFGEWLEVWVETDACGWVGATDKRAELDSEKKATLLRIAVGGHVEILRDQQQGLNVGGRLGALQGEEVWDVHAG